MELLAVWYVHYRRCLHTPEADPTLNAQAWPQIMKAA